MMACHVCTVMGETLSKLGFDKSSFNTNTSLTLFFTFTLNILIHTTISDLVLSVFLSDIKKV